MGRYLKMACVAALLALPTTAVADTLSTIKETGTIKIGYREDAPPFSLRTAIGEPAGYTVELCRGVATGIKDLLELDEIKVEYVPVGTGDRFEAVQDGRIDLLCGAATITLSRREIVDFSIPTFVTGASAMLPKNGAENFEALAGKKVGVRADTTTETLLHNVLDSLEVDAEVVPVDSHTDGLKMIEDGEIAAYFGDRAILLFLAASSAKKKDLRVLDEFFSYEPYGLALRRGDSDFRLAVDRILSAIYRTGLVEAIFRNSFGEAKPGDLLTALFLINSLPE